MERKLTAILSADVEGYSRLMGEDEEATIRTLTSYRQVMTTLIPMHRGRVVDSPGDNLLAEFASVVDAVKCAVVIQTTLRLENADLPQNRRMEFRIGINLGDVVVDGERIYGDGVNIAARMEALAYSRSRTFQSRSVPIGLSLVRVRYRLSHRRKSRHRGKTIARRLTFTKLH